MSEVGRQRVAAAFELLVAILLIAGIWTALPARWWPVDAVGTTLAVVLTGGAVGLLLKKKWGIWLSVAASWLTLAIGLVTISALAFSLSYLAGLYGPIGAGGAMILGAAAALLLPYLVGLPVIQLILLRRQSRTTSRCGL